MKITGFFIWNAFLFCQGIERIWFNITNAFLIHTYINHKDEIYFSGVNSIFYFCFIFVFCFFLFFVSTAFSSMVGNGDGNWLSWLGNVAKLLILLIFEGDLTCSQWAKQLLIFKTRHLTTLFRTANLLGKVRYRTTRFVKNVACPWNEFGKKWPIGKLL